jgi:hypothetical protein
MPRYLIIRGWLISQIPLIACEAILFWPKYHFYNEFGLILLQKHSFVFITSLGKWIVGFKGFKVPFIRFPPPLCNNWPIGMII